MAKKVVLSQLARHALLLAASNPQGEYRYQTLIKLFGFSKWSVSRSSRRMERAGLFTRFKAGARITNSARLIMWERALRPGYWLVPAMRVSFYIERIEPRERQARQEREQTRQKRTRRANLAHK